MASFIPLTSFGTMGPLWYNSLYDNRPGDSVVALGNPLWTDSATATPVKVAALREVPERCGYGE